MWPDRKKRSAVSVSAQNLQFGFFLVCGFFFPIFRTSGLTSSGVSMLDQELYLADPFKS